MVSWKTFLEESGLLIKGFSQAITNEAKEQKGGFLSMLLGRLGASLLGNVLTGTGPHPLKHFERKSIIKMSLNLIVFIQEIIDLK